MPYEAQNTKTVKVVQGTDSYGRSHRAQTVKVIGTGHTQTGLFAQGTDS